MYVAGIFWIGNWRPKVDYSKYLGPDWKPDYVTPATFVSNHASWLVRIFAINFSSMQTNDAF